MVIQIRTTLDEPETGQSFIPHRPSRPDKVEGGRPFKLVSEYQPSGDQPTAIAEVRDADPRPGADHLRLEDDLGEEPVGARLVFHFLHKLLALL